MQVFKFHSPILPLIINSSLLMLMHEAIDPNRPMSGGERGLLDARRAVSLDFLHKYFETQTHQQALQIIREAWKSRRHFGLYLRGFNLGAENIVHLKDNDSLESTDSQISEFFMIMSMADSRFQQTLLKYVAPKLPIISFENPAYDVRFGQSLPKLSLNGISWRMVAHKLIAAAAVIIVYYDDLTPGLSEELDLIRTLQRQGATIIIRPSANVSGLKKVYEMRRTAKEIYTSTDRQAVSPDTLGATNVTEDLTDFPTILAWDESDESVRRLEEAITGIPPHLKQGIFSKHVPEPNILLPPQDVKKWTDTSISAHMLLARKELEEANLAGAEDELTTCLTMSFWGDNSGARAVAFMWLGQIELYQEKIDDALGNIERAMDVLERLALSDYLFPSDAFLEISARLEQHQKQDRVRTVLQRIATLRIKSETQ